MIMNIGYIYLLLKVNHAWSIDNWLNALRIDYTRFSLLDVARHSHYASQSLPACDKSFVKNIKNARILEKTEAITLTRSQKLNNMCILCL